MREFFLSKNTNYPFELFGIQHIVLLLITILSFILIFIFRKKIANTSDRSFKILRIVMALIIFFNMFIYRVSYMYYGVYNIKIHLSLYFCHIVNYLFIISCLINYNKFYKIVYGLSFIGPLISVFFPNITSGIDCFIFYTFFISHNLLLVFILIIITKLKIKFSIHNSINSFIFAIIIFLITNLINFDFGTNYNTIDSFFPNSFVFNDKILYIFIILWGLIGSILGIIVSNLFIRHTKNNRT